jgi:hypothetical protein
MHGDDDSDSAADHSMDSDGDSFRAEPSSPMHGDDDSDSADDHVFSRSESFGGNDDGNAYDNGTADVHGSTSPAQHDAAYDDDDDDDDDDDGGTRNNTDFDQATTHQQPQEGGSQASASSQASAVRQQGLGIKPLRIVSIGQQGCPPWLLMNRNPCEWENDDASIPEEKKRYAIPRMRASKGYEYRRSRGCDKLKANRLKLAARIEEGLYLLNVFTNSQDIFQAHKRVADRSSRITPEKSYVYSNPQEPGPWGRQQAKVPINPPLKFDGDGKVVQGHDWTTLELALDGVLWKDCPDFQLMKNEDFQVTAGHQYAYIHALFACIHVSIYFACIHASIHTHTHSYPAYTCLYMDMHTSCSLPAS